MAGVLWYYHFKLLKGEEIMEYNLPFATWFWLLVPNALLVVLSLLRLILAETGDKQ